MTSSIRMLNTESNPSLVNSCGFASLSGYDPAVHRFMEAIKESINDEIPVLIRLHSTTDYASIPKSELYEYDMENHAVAIIGYDESERKYAIADPWTIQSKGDKGGLRWVDEEFLAYSTVDCSYGVMFFLSPLRTAVDEDANGGIKLETGFYIPKIHVMDADNMSLSDFNVEVVNKDGNVIFESAFDSTIRVDEKLEINIPRDELTSSENVMIHIRASIHGKRPYDFSDHVTATYSYTPKMDERIVIADDSARVRAY